MLNTASLRAISNSTFSRYFVRPRYDSYCFSNIPATLEFLLSGNGQSILPADVFAGLPTRYDKVVFFFADAFGWRFFEPYAQKHDFLKTALAQGVVSKMTSQFPSTTAAHTTCIHTGLEVGQSGVYEWNYYEPLVDEMISPLPFSYAGEIYDSLKLSSVPAEAFFPQQTFYARLREQGINAQAFLPRAYTSSTYSAIMFRGIKLHPYNSLQEMLVYLSELLKQQHATPSCYSVYFDRIDLVCHRYGPLAKQTAVEIETFLNMVDQLFYKNVYGQVGRTLLMLTADHGQVEVDPARTYYLNKQIAGIERYLKTNARGHPLVPAGSPRDMFLYIKEELIDEAVALLQCCLAGRAEVYYTRDLLAQHFFGQQQPTAVFLQRLGNVVVLPYKNETVWWYEEGKFSMNFYGHHGGLLPEEMEIPLLLLPL
ncbi:MAG: alkaline phosphatase family protein [Ktedonobacteraceae bacterium]|nr:alkaline phosphatase family protein [Ktedonobacteraceae bacterium]